MFPSCLIFVLFFCFYRMLLVGTGSGETHSSRCHFENKSSTNSWLSYWVCPTSSSYFSALFQPPIVPHMHWNMCSSDLIAGSDNIIFICREIKSFYRQCCNSIHFMKQNTLFFCYWLAGCIQQVQPEDHPIDPKPRQHQPAGIQSLLSSQHLFLLHSSHQRAWVRIVVLPLLCPHCRALVFLSFLRWRCTNICLLSLRGENGFYLTACYSFLSVQLV